MQIFFRNMRFHGLLNKKEVSEPQYWSFHAPFEINHLTEISKHFKTPIKKKKDFSIFIEKACLLRGETKRTLLLLLVHSQNDCS